MRHTSRNESFDLFRAWTRQREHFHRARTWRLLLPVLPLLLLLALLIAGVVDLPASVLTAVLWAAAALVYAWFWAFLIRDARRFVEEAAATDERFRSLIGDIEGGDTVAMVSGVGDRAVGPVVALAGRRVDARDARTPRFPLASVGVVQERLRAFFEAARPSALVCSAASGADLLALDIATRLSVHSRVILPFDRARFKQTSVTDRQGSWGPLYDGVLDRLPPEDLIVLPEAGDGTAAYVATNFAILEHAQRLAAHVPAGGGGPAAPGVVAVLVWDGRSRGDDDLTAAFGAEAERRGFRVEHIPTL